MITSYLESRKEIQIKQFESYRPSTRFRVSQLSNCQRRQVYETAAIPKQFSGSVENLITMDNGSAYHEMIQRQMMQAGILKPMYKPDGSPDEIKIIDHKLDLTGKVDGITVDEKTVIEIKTVHMEAYEHLVLNVKGPSPYHTTQLNTYLGLLKKKQGLFLYFNKNQRVSRVKKSMFESKGISQLAISFPYEFDPILYKETVELCYDLARWADDYPVTGELPEKIKKGSLECQSCPYQYTCRPGVA